VVSPTTWGGTGFDGDVGVLVGVGDSVEGEGAGVELVGDVVGETVELG
jgi:hypothetical protein